jgi:L-fuconolactonase
LRIDAHQHFWRYDPSRHAWITNAMSAIRRDFLPEHAAPLLAEASFDGSVAVEAHSSEDETDFLLQLAEQNPIIRGVVGWVDLSAANLDDRLARWSGVKALKGFRLNAQAEADSYLMREDVMRGVTTLGNHDYTFDILIYPKQLAAAERLVSRCPAVRFVLDHCAKPNIAGREIEAWRGGMGRLARHPNVACKISGLVTEARWTEWSDDDLIPYLDVTLSVFGAERLMFGSDWPVCLVASPYARWVDVVLKFADRLTPAERAALFGGTAASVYKLEV